MGGQALIKLITLITVNMFLALPAFSQVENFDLISPPELPDGWFSSASGFGNPPQFVTSNAFSDTSPNSLFSAGYNQVNRTMVHSPQFFMPKVPTQLIFRHRHQLQHGGTVNYDGAQLFFVPNIYRGHGPEYEWTAQFGSFSQGGYNGTVSNSYSNQIGGQQAWVRNQLSFITTVANFPPNQTAQTAQIAWALFSDSSISSQGWWIDSIEISPAADLKVRQSSNQSFGYLGSTVTVITEVANLSSTPATNARMRQTLPQDAVLLSAEASSGSVTGSGKVLNALFPVILPGGVETLSITISVPAQVSKAVFLEIAEGSQILRRTYALRHLPFSAPPFEGTLSATTITAFDFFPPTDDACQGQALGSAGTGKIGITVRGNCSLEQKIKNLQNAGGIAVIIIDDTDDPVAPGGLSAGITIPAFLAQGGDAHLLSQAAARGVQAALTGVSDSLHFTAQVLGDQFDPRPLNNTDSLVLPVRYDDRQEQFAGNILEAQKLLKSLKIGKTGKAKQAVKIKAQELLSLMVSISRESQTISALISEPKILPAVKQAERLVKKAAKLKGHTFAADKRRAAAALRRAYLLAAKEL